MMQHKDIVVVPVTTRATSTTRCLTLGIYLSVQAIPDVVFIFHAAVAELIADFYLIVFCMLHVCLEGTVRQRQFVVSNANGA